MKLPIPFLNENKESSAYYLALILTDEKVGAVILEEVDQRVKIISQEESILPTSIEHIAFDEFLNAVDKAVSRAEEVLPPNIETHNTVFGVKQSWVDDETKKIKKEYLSKLKKLCDSLDMTPLGFMVTSEAVTNLMQQEEGAPLSAILAEVGHKTITLTLVRGGKIVEMVDGPLHQHGVPQTVDSLLKQFTIPVLPARIILINSAATDELAQEFIHHQWSKSLPFLHVPQVTPLPGGFDAKAVTFGAASQLGFEVLGLPDKSDIQTLESDAKHQVSDEETLTSQHLEEPGEADAAEKETETQLEEPTDEEAAGPIPASHTPDNFGFVMEEDIATHPQGKRPFDADQEDEEEANLSQFHKQFGQQDDYAENDDAEDEERGMGGGIFAIIAGILNPLRQLIRIPRLPRLPFANKGPLIPLGILAFIIIVLIVGINFFYSHKMHANIVLTVSPKTVSQDEPVTFKINGSNDFSQGTIAASTITTSLDGESTTEATGKKDVGDKAKGKITIYNNSDSTQTLTSGTTITSSNNLAFTLDDSVTVASASGDVFSGTKPGTSDVNVTAKDIGTQFNLPSGTTFSISGDNLAGKNSSAFSGGTKKTVTVVAAGDITKLKNDIVKNLQSQAADQLNQKAGDGQTALATVLSSTMTKSTTDKNVGDEASKVTLHATLQFTGVAYSNNDMLSFAKDRLQNKNSDGKFIDSSIKTDLSNLKAAQDNKSVSGNATINGGLLPDINTTDVIAQLHHKSLGDAKDYLSHLPQVTSQSITFSPPVPLLPNLFPSLPNQISVEIKANN